MLYSSLVALRATSASCRILAAAPMASIGPYLKHSDSVTVLRESLCSLETRAWSLFTSYCMKPHTRTMKQDGGWEGQPFRAKASKSLSSISSPKRAFWLVHSYLLPYVRLLSTSIWPITSYFINKTKREELCPEMNEYNYTAIPQGHIQLLSISCRSDPPAIEME